MYSLNKLHLENNSKININFDSCDLSSDSGLFLYWFVGVNVVCFNHPRITLPISVSFVFHTIPTVDDGVFILFSAS